MLDAETTIRAMFRSDKVLIWSIEHNAYWRSDSMGYAKYLCNAGLYTFQEAKEICKKVNAHGREQERIIELDDAFTSLQLEVRMKVNQ